MKRIVGALLLGGLLPLSILAERLPLDSRMILDGERKLRSWTFNDPPSFKPDGDVKEVMEEGIPGLLLTSAGKAVQFYNGTPQEITHVLTVPEDVTMIRPEFSCDPGSKVEFFDVQLERLLS